MHGEALGEEEPGDAARAEREEEDGASEGAHADPGQAAARRRTGPAVARDGGGGEESVRGGEATPRDEEQRPPVEPVAKGSP